MPRQHPEGAGQADERHRHLRLPAVRVAGDVVHGAGREAQRMVRVKARDLAAPRGLAADGLAVRKEPLEEAHRLKEIEPMAFLEQGAL